MTILFIIHSHKDNPSSPGEEESNPHSHRELTTLWPVLGISVSCSCHLESTGNKFKSFFFLSCSFIDATYADPLGEAPVRPKTAGRQRPQQVEDEFGDEEIGDDLLPEWENKIWIVYWCGTDDTVNFVVKRRPSAKLQYLYIFAMLGFQSANKAVITLWSSWCLKSKKCLLAWDKSKCPKRNCPSLNHWSSRTSVLWSHYFIIILAHLTLRKAPHACSHCMSKCCWILV